MSADGVPLRLVLFGLPGAGKSALLGALAQVARTQESILGTRLSDVSPGLADLEKGLAPTRDEIVPHQVVSAPLPGNAALPRGEIALIDCNGQAAAGMLEGHAADAPGIAPQLADAIANADVLFLVVDATGDPAHVKNTFAQFGQFLNGLEESRARRAEVSGLPVYLVLSKSDLLAKPGDDFGGWVQRVEERKLKIHQGFVEYLARLRSQPALTPAVSPLGGDARGAELPFGELDLHVWATATGRPALANPGAAVPTHALASSEPYGVAELFRQGLESAEEFRRRCQRAGRWLQATVASALALVSLLFGLAAVFYHNRPDPMILAMQSELQMVLPSADTRAADRLKEPLGPKLEKLRAVQQNPDFGKLPESLRAEVGDYLNEIRAYQDFEKQFNASVPSPSEADRDKTLEDIEAALNNLPMPPSYAELWRDTRIGKRIRQWRADIPLLRQAVADTIAWCDQRKKEGEKLKTAGLSLLVNMATRDERQAWIDSSYDYLDKTAPHAPSDRVKDSSLTYETVYQFDRVIDARTRLETFQRKELKPVLELVQNSLSK